MDPRMIRSPTSDVVQQKLVFTTALGNLVFDKTSLHEIDGDKATVSDAVSILSEHNFLALPVYRMQTQPVGVTSGIQSKVYYGYVSTFDVVVCIMDRINKGDNVETAVTNLYKMPASVLIRTPESLKIRAEEPTTVLKSVFDIFANPNRHVHRILVRQRKASATEPYALRMLEQEDIIRFLLSNADVLGTFVHRSVEELGMLKNRNVVYVTDKETALDACKKMVTEDVNGLGIVHSDTGGIYGTFSSSDLRGMTPENAASLNLPVVEYLKEIHYGVVPAPTVCVRGTPLYALMAATQMPGVFRIYVVNEKNVPVNVLTLTDILQQFLIRANREL